MILQTQPNASGSGIVIQNTAKTINDSGGGVSLLNQPAQVCDLFYIKFTFLIILLIGGIGTSN